LLIDIRKVEDMPRPRKWRKVCCMPGSTLYGPLNGFLDDSELIIMSVEEYETIRLIDQEGLNQEECAEKMQVARATVQNIYKAARSKMAESLVNGRMLKIEGEIFSCTMTTKEPMAVPDVTETDVLKIMRHKTNLVRRKLNENSNTRGSKYKYQ
jgi:uncharacterized protein